RCSSYLTVFGTRVDSVHIQHSLLLLRKLNELNIDYKVQIYPDENHHLLKSAPHFYRKVINYLHINSRLDFIRVDHLSLPDLYFDIPNTEPDSKRSVLVSSLESVRMNLKSPITNRVLWCCAVRF